MYKQAYSNGLLEKNIRAAFNAMKSCTLCPRRCKVNRLEGEKGICKTGRHAVVASYQLHFGEESCLVGRGGSGTIFFTHCNLLCNFCQNFDISHLGQGIEVNEHKLAEMMINLQESGAENINFVTPSHVVPQILAALPIAIENGLTLPLVYNTSAYDYDGTLKLLDGIIDIYMPDFKFMDADLASLTCDAKDYPGIAQGSLIEMHRQVGDLIIENGVAKSGLLVRHLVLPGYLEDTRKIMRFISNNISPDTFVNIMPQYRPCGMAYEIKELSVSLSYKDYVEAINIAREEGIERIDKNY